MTLEELATPAALVELQRLEANCARMAERLRALGVRLRPHVKTHKTVEAARLQVAGHFGGITVSTLAEAEFFAAAGFADITYAVPIAPQRLRDAANLARRVARLTLLLDHEATAAAAEACAHEQGIRLAVLLKVDCGAHRAGVDPRRRESVAFASRLASSPYLELRGVLTHAGHAYRAASRAEAAAVAAEERDVTVGFAERLRRAGVPVAEVSIGSTPTMTATEDLAGVTEARPGNYAFFDAFQAAIGSCGYAECAFSVLTTVIGSYPERGTLVVDAGALALSRDEGPRHVDPGCGYGVLLAPDGRHLAGLRLVSLSQEHGVVEVRPPQSAGAFPPGSRLRVVPNHSCLAAALFERYHVVRGNEVLDQWRPCRGW